MLLMINVLSIVLWFVGVQDGKKCVFDSQTSSDACEGEGKCTMHHLAKFYSETCGEVRQKDSVINCHASISDGQ